MKIKINRISQGKKVINCGENYSISIRLILKTRFVGGKKKNAIMNEMFFKEQTQIFVQRIVFLVLSPIFVL